MEKVEQIRSERTAENDERGKQLILFVMNYSIFDKLPIDNGASIAIIEKYNVSDGNDRI